MDVANLGEFLAHAPWAIALVVGVPVVGKIIITTVALRGAEPRDRANIIKAVAELFRTSYRRGR